MHFFYVKRQKKMCFMKYFTLILVWDQYVLQYRQFKADMVQPPNHQTTYHPTAHGVICLKQQWASYNTSTGPRSSPVISLFACKTIPRG